ncbi:MAG: class I SAM-dependent methyltransferase [Deltaproteobacteria bacterium]
MSGSQDHDRKRNGGKGHASPRWFEPIFDKRYPELFGPIEGDSEGEAREIVDLLSPPPGAVIADIGCGRGRHAVPLARMGYRVVGVDYSEKMLLMGRARAEREGVEVEWVREDMRTFRRPDSLDFAVSLFSSFGFFSDEENQTVLENIGASLKDRGTLLLDLRNVAKGFSRPSDNEQVLQVPAGLLRMKVRYDRVLGRARAEHVLMRRDGIRISSIFDVRIYNRRELEIMLRIAGMQVRGVYGSLSGAALTRSSNRMVVVADKMQPDPPFSDRLKNSKGGSEL